MHTIRVSVLFLAATVAGQMLLVGGALAAGRAPVAVVAVCGSR